MERGFAFRGKVLRPAKVIVAKRAPKEERKDGE
jgi:molecular chaperone GrpE (heat shock protein)